ncbi:iS3 family transposase [Mycobacterium xenopi 3993]|nr:iS3 family transposase [Mycobacterium xenopi 3993]
MVDEIRGESEFAATYGSPRVGWNCATVASGSAANASSGSCAKTDVRGLPASRLEARVDPAKPQHTAAPDLLAATSPPPHPTRSGSPI